MKKVFLGLSLTLVFNVAFSAQTRKDSANSAAGTVKQSVSRAGFGISKCLYRARNPIGTNKHTGDAAKLARREKCEGR